MDNIIENNNNLELKKWRKTCIMTMNILKQVDNYPIVVPENDSDLRSILIDLSGKVVKKALNPIESNEYIALKSLYEHQQRQYKRLKKRTERLMNEIERNRLLLEEHQQKIKLNDQIETEKMLNNINNVLIQPLQKNHHHHKKNKISKSFSTQNNKNYNIKIKENESSDYYSFKEDI